MAMTATVRKAFSADVKVPGRNRAWPALVAVDGNLVSSSDAAELDTLAREVPGAKDKQRVDLGELARGVVEQLQAEGQLAHVEVKCHLPEEAVKVDVPRWPLEQVLAHLVSCAASALEAMQDRARVLRVIVEPADEFGDFGPRLCVQDSGAGTVVEAVAQALCARVEKLGGKLTVKNRPMAGRRFTIELPADPVASW